MASTLIMGAGYLGSAIGTALAELGDKVVCVRRHEMGRPSSSSLRSPSDFSALRYVAGDLRDKRMREKILEAVSEDSQKQPWGGTLPIDRVVVTLAPMKNNGYGDFLRAIEGSVEVAQRLNAKTIFYSSSTGVYREQDGGIVDEHSPLAEVAGLPERSRGGALVEAEQMIQASGISTCIFRLSGIYGPGRDPIPRYLDPRSLPLHGEFWTNRIRVEDIVAAFLLLNNASMKNEIGPQGEKLTDIYNCTDDCPVKAIDIARWLALQQGRAWIEPIQFVNATAEPRSHKQVSNSRLRALGWTPAFPSYKEGMKEFL